MLAQPILPLLPWRQSGPAREHERDGLRAGQVLGHLEADAPEAAGNQVHAALTHPCGGPARLLDGGRLDALHPAVHPAIRDRCTIARSEQFAREIFHEPIRPTRVVGLPLHVDAAAAERGKLVRDHAARSEQRGLGRAQRRFIRHALHVVRQHADGQRLVRVFGGERLPQVEQAVESAILFFAPERGLRALVLGRRHVPGVDDVAQLIGIDGLQERRVVVRVTRPDREVPRIDLLERRARRDADGRGRQGTEREHHLADVLRLAHVLERVRRLLPTETPTAAAA